MTSNLKLKTAEGFTLNAIFTKVPGSKGVIFLHGMTVDKDDEGIFVRSEPELNKLGFSTIRFDFRAHGKSSGVSMNDFTISGELIDLETVVKFMDSQGINNLGLAGASFGGSIAALYIQKHPKKVNSLFLANPVLDYEKGFLTPTTLWALKYFANAYEKFKNIGFIEVASRKFKLGKPLFDEMRIYNPCESLKSFKGPIMIVHGDRDDKVSLEDTKVCFESLPNTKKQMKVLKGAEHGFHTEPYEHQVAEMIVEFFKK